MGLSLPTAYFIMFALNLRAVDAPRYPITLAVLVIPALVAAYGGAVARRLSQTPTPSNCGVNRRGLIRSRRHSLK